MPHDSPRAAPVRQPIHVRYVSDIPREKHWAILREDTISTSGYHDNDPPGRENVVRYEAYTDFSAWETEVKRLTLEKNQRTCWRAIMVEVPTVTATVEVTIK